MASGRILNRALEGASRCAELVVLALVLLPRVLLARVLLALGLTFTLSAPGSANAQEQSADSLAMARAMFEQGIALGDQGNHEEAAAQLRRSYTLRPSPVAAYNLALQDVAIGQFVEARDMLHAAIRSPHVRDALRRSAEGLLSTVEPRVAYLTLDVRGAPAGAVVTIDRQTVAPRQLGVEVPRDPGRYVAQVRLDRTLLAEAEFELSEGERETVWLRVVPGAAAQASRIESERADAADWGEAETPSDSSDTRESDSDVPVASAHDDTPLWVGVGVGGGVLLVAAVVIGVVLSSNQTPPRPPNSPFEPSVVVLNF